MNATEAKRRTIESAARRIRPRECRHVGQHTTTTTVAGTSARRLWCLCEVCEQRAGYLYQPEPGDRWACAKCHALIYERQQQRGTREAFAQWLTPARWEWASSKHPAQHELYERMAELWREQCAPLDWSKLDAEQRADLLETFASPEAVARVFNSQRAKWSAEVETLAQAAGEEIARDLWAWWKDKQRRPKRAKVYRAFQK